MTGRLQAAKKLQQGDPEPDAEERGAALLEGARERAGARAAEVEQAMQDFARWRVRARLARAKAMIADDAQGLQAEPILRLIDGAAGVGGPARTEAEALRKEYLDALGRAATSSPRQEFETDGEGWVKNRLLLGGFPSPDHAGFQQDFLAGEAGHDAFDRLPVPGPENRLLRWRRVAVGDPKVRLKEQLGVGDWVICYAAVLVEAAQATDVEFRLGYDDGLKMWLDREEKVSDHYHGACIPDMRRFATRLKPGRTRVLPKIEQWIGDYEFMMRVVKPDGTRVPGLRILN